MKLTILDGLLPFSNNNSNDTKVSETSKSLPLPKYRRLDQNSTEPTLPPLEAYNEYSEPVEAELRERVEYDLDEQGKKTRI